MTHHIRVRAAATGDVAAIHALLAPMAEAKVILPRDEDDICQHLQEFLVAEYDGRVVGAVAMHVYGVNLGEVRSLVVDDALRGHGVGRLLVEACERWAKTLGVARLFALTYVADFFVRMGYRVVSKESLPHKIWTVCVHCAKFAECDEIAVEKRLSDAPIRPMRVVPIIEATEED